MCNHNFPQPRAMSRRAITVKKRREAVLDAALAVTIGVALAVFLVIGLSS